MEAEPIKVNLFDPGSWPAAIEQWRDSGAVLDLTGPGYPVTRVPQELLDLLPDPDGQLGPMNCSGAVLEAVRWVDCTFTGDANFTNAVFGGEVDLRGARFTRGAWFTGARFKAVVSMWDATFEKGGGFMGASFDDQASFGGADFLSVGLFDGTTFQVARFERATFQGGCGFSRATFSDNADFDNAAFDGPVDFENAVFEREAQFNQVSFAVGANFDKISAVEIDLSLASFVGSNHELVVTSSDDDTEVAINAQRVRVDGDLILIIGAGCELNAARIVARSPVTIVAAQPHRAGALTSLAYADITAPFRIGRHVNLSGTQWGDHDLTTITLADTSTLPLLRGRRILAGDGPKVDAGELVVLERNYRDLRRQLEATANTHSANDFYYGEMNTRRRQRPWKSVERWLLEAYRIVSGYGTRAWTAIAAWLVLTLAATRLLLIGDVDINKTGEDLTWAEVWRFTLEASLSFFRPTNAPALSVPETFIVLVVRVAGPVLFALAALAIRNRIKR